MDHAEYVESLAVVEVVVATIAVAVAAAVIGVVAGDCDLQELRRPELEGKEKNENETR